MSDPKHGEGSMTSEDDFGIGMLADGKLNVVPNGELAARIAARDAEEAVDDESPSEEAFEDYSDLLDEPPEA